MQRLEGGEKWTDYEEQIGAFEVNPGAMLATENLLLVGSLDRGLFVMDILTGKWENITDGLASNNVTSLAVDDRYYYVGTDRGVTLIPRDDIE